MNNIQNKEIINQIESVVDETKSNVASRVNVDNADINRVLSIIQNHRAVLIVKLMKNKLWHILR